MTKTRGKLLSRGIAFAMTFAMMLTSVGCPSSLAKASTDLSLLDSQSINNDAFGAEDEVDELKKKEIDQGTYDSLGIVLPGEEVMDSNDKSPFGTDENQSVPLYTANEIYVATNGWKGNSYSVRNGFDRLSDPHEINRGADRSNGWGNMDGAYAYYGTSPSSIKSGNGYTTGSKISSNRGNSLNVEYNGFSGLYSTSVALDGGDGKDNYVAELRAYGDNVKSHDHWGKIEVQIFKISAGGKRTLVYSYEPKYNDNSFFSDRYRYFTRLYVQELDAVFEIQKADVNGDGLDDLFVYTGRYADDANGNRIAYVDALQGTGNGQFVYKQDLTINCGPSKWFDANPDWHIGLRKVPVVTLAGGDLKKGNDGTENIVVTASAPTDHSKVADIARAKVFECPAQANVELTVIPELEDISLAAPNGNVAMVSANCTFGEFALPTDRNVKGNVLFLAGYQSNNETSYRKTGTYGIAAFKYVYYNPSSGRYEISNYYTQKLEGRGYNIADSYSNARDGHWRPTHAPIALACADLFGLNKVTLGHEQSNYTEDMLLFGGEVYYLHLYELPEGADRTLTNLYGSVSLCDGQVTQHNNDKKKEQVWIGDVRVGCVDTDPAANGWRESFVYTVGVHRDGKLNTSEDYYWMDIAAFSTRRDDGGNVVAYSSQEGVLADSNSRNDTYGTFISLCLPDIDNDSMFVKFREKYLVHSNPEVYAVLQSAPFFKDVEESFGYLDDSSTTYGSSTGSGSSNGGSISQSVGAYVSGEVQLFGDGEFEIEVAAKAGYEYENSKTTEYEIEYSAAGGAEDQVVVFASSYIYYIYDVYDPTTNSWGEMVTPVCIGNATHILDVDEYDEIASETKGLKPVRGAILNNTVGEPSTYAQPPQGKREYEYKGEWSAVAASSGASQTQTISVSEENSHTLEVGLEVNTKVGGGAALLGNKLTAGITTSTEAGYSHTWLESNGSSFSGTVDNVPSECKDYSFSWKLVVNSYEFSKKQKAWIVGYTTKNTIQPPHMPTDLAVVEVGRNYVDLEWEGSPEAEYYEVYIVDAAGNYNKKATVPGSQTDCHVTGLSSNRTYKFVVRAVNGITGVSIFTPVVMATTLYDKQTFAIVNEPEDEHVHAGATAEFATLGSYTNADGESVAVGYQWQVDDGKGWTNLNRQTSAVLNISDVKKSMDGNEYRCRIYVDDMTLYTNSATLYVDKSVSKTTISAYNDTQDKQVIENGTDNVANVDASVDRYKNITQYSKTPITINDKYHLLKIEDKNGESAYVWYDGTDYYKNNKDLTELYDSGDRADLIRADVTFVTGDIGEKLSFEDVDFVASVDVDVEADENGTVRYVEPIEIALEATSELDLDTLDDEFTIHYLEQHTEIEYDGEDEESGNATSNIVTDADITFSKEDIIAAWELTVGEAEEEVTYKFYEAVEHITEDGQTIDYNWYVYTTDDGVTYKSFDMNSSKALAIDADTDIVITNTEDVYQTVETLVSVYDHTDIYEGDTITLSAKATDKSFNTIKAGSVKFVVSGPVPAVIPAGTPSEAGEYTATWKPTAEGTYTIYARYENDSDYFESTSSEMTIFTVLNGTSKLDLTATNNSLSYGESTMLSLSKTTILGDDTSAFVISDYNDEDYIVKILEQDEDTGKSSYKTANPNDYDIINGRFIPYAVGSYQISATKDEQTAIADITVSKADLIISAIDKVVDINDAEKRAMLDWSIHGYAPWDSYNLPVVNQDFVLSSDGVLAINVGEYAINTALVMSNTENTQEYTEKIKTLQKNYIIRPQNGIYTLESERYDVDIALESSHGSASMSYRQSEDSDIEVKLAKATRLFAGSYVVWNASPAAGYQIKCWKDDDGNIVTASNGSINDSSLANAYKGGNIIVSNLTKDTHFSVDFEPIYHTLSFASNDTGKGTVKANYVTNGIMGNSFSSGSNVHADQTVRIKATPKTNYVIDHWEVKTGDKITVVKATDGTSDFTGTTYDLTGPEEDTEVTVYFVANETFNLNISSVIDSADGESSQLVKNSEFVVVDVNDGNEKEISVNEDGSYTVNYGANIEVRLAPRSGYIVNNWTDAENHSVSGVSADGCTLSLYKVMSDKDLVIHYTVPNEYNLKFSTDGLYTDVCGNVTAELVDNTTAIETDTTMYQGVTVKFTANVAEGYEVAYWTVNNVKQDVSADGDINSFIVDYLDGNTVVKAYIVKKPIIKFISDANLTITAKLDGKTITSGTAIPYGSKNITFEVTPKTGYEVNKTWTLNGSNITATIDSTNDKAKYTLASYMATDYDVNADVTTGIVSDVTIEVKSKAIPKHKLSLTVKKVDTAGTGVFGNATADITRKNLTGYKKTLTVGKSTSALTTSYSFYDGSDIKISKATVSGYYFDGYEYKIGAAAWVKSNTLPSFKNVKQDIQVVVRYHSLIAQTIGATIKPATVLVGEKSAITVKSGLYGAVKYTALNPTIATVNSYGKISTLKEGTAKFKITVAGDAKHKAASQTVTLVVKKDDTTANRNILDQKLLSTFVDGKITFTWKALTKAEGYDIFIADCGADYSKSPNVTIKDGKKESVVITKVAGKTVSQSNCYKMYVKAYRTVNGKKTYIGQSLTCHVAGVKNKTKTNPKSITVKNTTVTINKGKTSQISATVNLENTKKKLLGHTPKLRYWSMNTAVATVSSTGVITGKSAGTVKVYVMAENGVKKVITVTVK